MPDFTNSNYKNVDWSEYKLEKTINQNFQEILSEISETSSGTIKFISFISTLIFTLIIESFFLEWFNSFKMASGLKTLFAILIAGFIFVSFNFIMKRFLKKREKTNPIKAFKEIIEYDIKNNIMLSNAFKIKYIDHRENGNSFDSTYCYLEVMEYNQKACAKLNKLLSDFLENESSHINKETVYIIKHDHKEEINIAYYFNRSYMFELFFKNIKENFTFINENIDDAKIKLNNAGEDSLEKRLQFVEDSMTMLKKHYRRYNQIILQGK